MTKGYRASRFIDAPAETIWGFLTNASTYADWNRAVLSIEGPITTGGTIKLVSIASPKRTFTLKVASMEPPRRMIWSSGMPLGLFKGVRTFVLEPSGTGTDFSISEEFTGPLSGPISRSIPDLTDSFDQFADGLKAVAEDRSGQA